MNWKTNIHARLRSVYFACIFAVYDLSSYPTKFMQSITVTMASICMFSGSGSFFVISLICKAILAGNADPLVSYMIRLGVYLSISSFSDSLSCPTCVQHRHPFDSSIVASRFDFCVLFCCVFEMSAESVLIGPNSLLRYATSCKLGRTACIRVVLPAPNAPVRIVSGIDMASFDLKRCNR